MEEDGVKNYATAYQLRVVVKIGSRSQIEPFCNCNGGRLFIKVVVSRIDGAKWKDGILPIDGNVRRDLLLLGAPGWRWRKISGRW